MYIEFVFILLQFRNVELLIKQILILAVERKRTIVCFINSFTLRMSTMAWAGVELQPAAGMSSDLPPEWQQHSYWSHHQQPPRISLGRDLKLRAGTGLKPQHIHQGQNSSVKNTGVGVPGVLSSVVVVTSVLIIRSDVCLCRVSHYTKCVVIFFFQFSLLPAISWSINFKTWKDYCD